MVRAIASRGGLLVAFSGGVDSGLVARVARDALGDRAEAVLADSESLARRELREARTFADEIGIPLRIVSLSELSNSDYAANPTNRCYFCRSELGVELVRIAKAEGFPGGVGENVAIGYGSPSDVWWKGWYRASDHHRNGLSDAWNCGGYGYQGSVGTENFSNIGAPKGK